MKFNFKSKRVVTGIFVVLLTGFGVYDPSLVGLGTAVTCEAVKCDA